MVFRRTLSPLPIAILWGGLASSHRVRVHQGEFATKLCASTGHRQASIILPPVDTPELMRPLRTSAWQGIVRPLDA